MNNQLNALVSVVVPTYSRSTMLIRAISSLNEQTYRPLEIVIVDDNGLGSAQQLETKRRIDSFCCNPGIELNYVAHELNKGGACARNTGIKNAKGEYIAFLDDDDIYKPTKIEKQLEVFTNPKVGVVYAYCDAMDASGSITHCAESEHIYEGNCIFDQAFTGCIAATSQWLCRKKALLDAGGFTISPAKQDSILLFKMLLNGWEIGCVPESLSIYCADANSRISTSGKALVGERMLDDLILQNLDRFSSSERRLIKSAISFRIGRLYIKSGHRLKGNARLLLSGIFSPKSFACFMEETIRRKRLASFSR